MRYCSFEITLDVRTAHDDNWCGRDERLAVCCLGEFHPGHLILDYLESPWLSVTSGGSQSRRLQKFHDVFVRNGVCSVFPYASPFLNSLFCCQHSYPPVPIAISLHPREWFLNLLIDSLPVHSMHTGAFPPLTERDYLSNNPLPILKYPEA